MFRVSEKNDNCTFWTYDLKGQNLSFAFLRVLTIRFRLKAKLLANEPRPCTKLSETVFYVWKARIQNLRKLTKKSSFLVGSEDFIYVLYHTINSY